MGHKECPSLIWKYLEHNNGEKGHKQKQTCCFSNMLDDHWRDIINLKDELTGYTWVVQKTPTEKTKQNKCCFKKYIALKLKISHQEKIAELNRTFLIFFHNKTVTYLEFNFDIISWSCLCSLKLFSEKQKFNLRWRPMCLDMDSLYD